MRARAKLASRRNREGSRAARDGERRRRQRDSVLVGGDLLALRLDVAQARVEHRGVDEVDGAAAAGEALAGAQAVDRADQVAERVARLGLGADRAQRQAEPAPGLAERAPGERIVRVDARPRSAASAALAFSAALSGALAGVASERELRREQQRSAASRRPRRLASPRRPAPARRGRAATAPASAATARSARALLRGLPRTSASAFANAASARAQSRSRLDASALSYGGAQLVGGAAVAVGVARLPAAQRVDARVHQHPRARLRDRVLEHARRGARGRRRCRARARASPMRSTVSGWLRRYGKAAEVVEARRHVHLLEHRRHAAGREAGRGHHLEADAVGLALHVAREVELALDRRRLACRRRRRSIASGLRLRDGREQAERRAPPG